MASTPRARRCLMRHRNSGGKCSGSHSEPKVRLGSTLDTTARASNVSPEARATPTARSFLTSTCETAVPVRTSTPCRAAATTSARARAAGPPSTSNPRDAATHAFASWRSSCSPLPADHGPSIVAEQPVGGDGRPQQLGLERLADEISHRHRSPAEKPPLVSPGEPPKGAAPSASTSRDPAGRGRRRPAASGRRACRDARDVRERARECRPRVGIVCRPGSNGVGGPSGVRGDRQRAPLRRREPSTGWAARRRTARTADSCEILDDVRTHRTGAVRERRDAKPWRELVLGGAASGDVAPLEQQRAEARPCRAARHK